VTLFTTTKTALITPKSFHLSSRPVNLTISLQLEKKILSAPYSHSQVQKNVGPHPNAWSVENFEAETRRGATSER
jgi:hypothetical protein